jgi:hypothetical protein
MSINELLRQTSDWKEHNKMPKKLLDQLIVYALRYNISISKEKERERERK